MLMEKVFERFVKQTPFAVMSRSLLERTLPPEAVDALFEEKADTQYTRELTFSSVVDLMGQVVTSAFGSVRAAYLNKTFNISVSLTSLYNKLQGIEPAVSAELVAHTARQLQPLIQEIGGALPEPVPGYQMHVLDGNNIAACEHRLAETRDNSAAPLPGKSLCVFRPAYQLVTDIVPCEDGHAQRGLWLTPSLSWSRKTPCGWPIATSASSVSCWASPRSWASSSFASMLASTTR
jgi:hypothetical protein